jgi:ribosomal protein L37AE/L43A
MHGENMDKLNARQVKACNIFKKSRLKLLKTKAAIWFNKKCRARHVKPKYMHINTNNKASTDNRTINSAIPYRINQDIKFLYCKKQNLNNQLLQLHIQGANLINEKREKYQLTKHKYVFVTVPGNIY